MTLPDWAAVAAVALVLVGPGAWQAAAALLRRTPVLPPDSVTDDTDQWRQETISSLVKLQGQCESRKMPNAVALCKSLLWEILGGGPHK